MATRGCINSPNCICYICGSYTVKKQQKNISNFVQKGKVSIKKKKDISYPTIIRSAILPVPHGPDLPIFSPPGTLDNILDDLDQITHISSDSDDGYDPGTNDP
ncbi:hypothetical protein TNCV_2275421 [Trichonephila clavipes]|nr:hypothetical protein TNCV_2275421 [Trichonephila clavipes]